MNFALLGNLLWLLLLFCGVVVGLGVVAAFVYEQSMSDGGCLI